MEVRIHDSTLQKPCASHTERACRISRSGNSHPTVCAGHGRKTRWIIASIILTCSLLSTGSAPRSTNKTTSSSTHSHSVIFIGTATWYNRGTNANPIMANGQPLNEYAHSCALPWHPDGARYKVTTLTKPSMTVVVTHTDTGPAKWTGNLVDLTPAAFRKIGKLGKGKIAVKIEKIR